jgi:UDP-N-acetylglucosamine--N-acetylmuramyl-(pentapeptide) pyrophosphoryl-undecaprenol N-acetylglucosamine transferase
VKIVVAGGGTAGHVFPGLALARALRERGHETTFIGTERGLEARLVPAAGFTLHVVEARPFVRKLSPAAILAPVAAVRTVRRCRRLVAGVDAVVGMGGYVSVSAVLAARRERIPIVLHEQNAVPGLANRALARVADAVALTFPESRRSFPRRGMIAVTGNPVREEILRVREDRDTLAKEAHEELELEDHRKTVVIFGGSQGALHVNRAAVGACRLLASREDLQVVLITGPAHLVAIARGVPPPSSEILVRLFGYLERMELAYAAADLVVSRSGATTVAEVTACGLPALLIPYPYATGRHQEANARSLQRAGGAAVLLDEHLSADVLATRISSLVDHDERLGAMAARSSAFGRPNAAARLADVVEAVAASGRCRR